jgi:hypothetical protein
MAKSNQRRERKMTRKIGSRRKDAIFVEDV